MLNVAPVLLPSNPYDPRVLKDSTPSLYMRHQQYSLAVIELVEVAPPTPRRLSSVIQSTSYFSSSAGSEDDDDDDDDIELSESEMDVEDDHPHDVESYCSSDIDRDGGKMPQPIHNDSSFQRRIKRILQWRERSYLSGDSNPSKPEFVEIDARVSPITFDEPQSFKRTSSSSSSSSASRSSMVSTSSSFADPSSLSLACRRYSKSSSITSAELEMHPCPACDAFFPTHETLRAHGLATGNEACCVAVEYAFEK